MASAWLMVLLSVVVLVKVVGGGTWCIARINANDQALQTALDYACGAGADCAPIQQSGLCYLPNTLQSHASYAFNSYFQRKAMGPGTCDFSGNAVVSVTDPSYGSCVYPSSASSWGAAMASAWLMVLLSVVVLVKVVGGGTWCIARINANDQALQTALDYACGAGADCAPIQQSGLCYLPNTLQSHASYAFNSYFQRKAMGPGTCDFSGNAVVSVTDPSYGSCVYPSSASMAGGTVTPPSTGTPTLTPPTPTTMTPTTGGFSPTGFSPPISSTDTSKASYLHFMHYSLAFLPLLLLLT